MDSSAKQAFSLRDARSPDFESVHRLNQSEVPHLGTLTRQQLETLADQATRFRVAESADGSLLGFLIAMDEHSSYQSPNYLWFRERYERFVYVDRIAVAREARLLGLGRALYADLEQWMKSRCDVLGCEVNLRPPNPDSMRFHSRLSFSQEGTQEFEGGAKAVAMLVKRVQR